MRFRCPNCSAVIEGEPGSELACPQCGFKASVPGSAAPPAPEPRPASASAPEARLEPAIQKPPVWGYLTALLALGTFFLASYGVPFLLAIAGISLGFWSHTRSRADPRGLIAIILGVVALVAAGAFLALG